MKQPTMRQVLLITDGCSNQGESPESVARLAQEHGVTVNVIGILDDFHNEQPRGLEEIEAIAQSGGGMSRVVYADTLSQTVQMVTQQALTETIQGFVHKELEQILGDGKDLLDVEPEKRSEIIETVENFSEVCTLEIVVLTDTSASMSKKLQAVQDALLDLSLSLQARAGKHRMSLFRFPSKTAEAEKLLDRTTDLSKIDELFPQLTSGGITPTGPALRICLEGLLEANLGDLQEDVYKEA